MVWWTANYGIKLHIVLYNVSVSWNILWFIVFFVLDVLWLWLQIILGIHLHLVYPFFPVTTVHCFPLVSDWFDWWYTLIDLIDLFDGVLWLTWLMVCFDWLDWTCRCTCISLNRLHEFSGGTSISLMIYYSRQQIFNYFLCPCTSFITKQDEINTET